MSSALHSDVPTERATMEPQATTSKPPDTLISELKSSTSAIGVDDNASNFLDDSLTTLFGEPPIEDDEASGETRYGALVMRVAKQALTLLADHLFSSSLLLAEQIELGRIDLRNKLCVELGAGCGLPSLLSATRSPGPSYVVLTDYPADIIIEPLAANVERNRTLFSKGCDVQAVGYEWGSDPVDLLKYIRDGASRRFDVVFLSDLLYFDRSHAVLVSSVTLLLTRTPSARVYVAAGNYTPPAVCDSFFAIAKDAGLVFEEQTAPADVWHGTPDVWRTRREQLSLETLGKRKASCRWWIGRWAY